ncbi:MAG TPA: helix-turn-helix domain-containing protein [Candidatus Limnocylindria bacterium]|nr:helix-turn-helix domain-containing protein [Candidatus Limnocylindria bacterium]
MDERSKKTVHGVRTFTPEDAMALRSTLCLTLSPEQRAALERLRRVHHTPQQLALRARMILLAGDGRGVRETARLVGVEAKTVRLWRRRWLAATDADGVADRLADAPRSGAPATFTAEQVCAIVALACEPPSARDARSPTGARARWPARRSSAGWSARSRSARSGAC